MKQRDLLQTEIHRLRNPNFATLRSPLPSPSQRVNELPKGYGQHTVPARSKSVSTALRTGYLDDSINNQLKQRSREELLASRLKINEPHASYDIDGDGFISQGDYQLAKRFDVDGNGVIDKQEMDAGKRLIAKELWERYRAQHFLQKPPITDDERQEHVEELVQLKDQHGAFMREFERVKNKHWIEEQRGSAQVLECVSKPINTMYQPNMPQHPVPAIENSHPRTRSELLDARKRNYTKDVNERYKVNYPPPGVKFGMVHDHVNLGQGALAKLI